MTLSFNMSLDSFNSRGRILEILRKPINICGRIYKIFSIKEMKSPNSDSTDHYFATKSVALVDITIDELFEWCISPRRNINKQASKLWSQIPLVFSMTTATVEFCQEEIRSPVKDILSKNGETMTDSCAKASPAVFREIWGKGLFGIKHVCTSVQGEIGGAKGVWSVDMSVDPDSEEKWIEIHDS